MSTDRPQYGEYATPEEQRARAGLPPLESDAVASVPHDAPANASAPPHSPVSVRPAAAPAARPANPIGRLITAVLLGMGLVNVLMSIPGFFDLSTTLSASMQMLGVEGEFTNFAAARTWGTVSAVVMMVGYAATVWLSFRRIKAGRSAWWIPLVGFVVTMLAVSACISVPMMGDPAFTQSLLTPPAG